MEFLTNMLSSDTAKFIAHHAIRGIIQASGRVVPVKPAKTRDLQCVKLTKEHEAVVRMVTFWCNLRINTLQQNGANPEVISKITQADARFLTMLSHAISTIGEPDAPDAWLFFDGDVQGTDFFELQYCDRGTRITRASYVLHASH